MINNKLIFTILFCLPFQIKANASANLDGYKSMAATIVLNYQTLVSQGIEPLIHRSPNKTISCGSYDSEKLPAYVFEFKDIARYAEFQKRSLRNFDRQNSSDLIKKSKPSHKYKELGLRLVHQTRLSNLNPILNDGSLRMGKKFQRNFLAARTDYSIYHPIILKDLNTTTGMSGDSRGQVVLIFNPELLDDYPNNHFLTEGYCFAEYGLAISANLDVPEFYDAILKAVKEQELYLNELIFNVDLPLTFLEEILLPISQKNLLGSMSKEHQKKVRFFDELGNLIKPFEDSDSSPKMLEPQDMDKETSVL